MLYLPISRWTSRQVLHWKSFLVCPACFSLFVREQQKLTLEIIEIKTETTSQIFILCLHFLAYCLNILVYEINYIILKPSFTISGKTRSVSIPKYNRLELFRGVIVVNSENHTNTQIHFVGKL
jgi:hypothetical protein